MAATTSATMVDPEVWADMTQAEFQGRVILGQEDAFARVDSTLEGNPGSTLSFAEWLPLSDMDELAETDVLVPETMDTTESSHTIKEAGKAVEIKDRALLVGYGDPLGEARRQFGRLTARKVDNDLRAAAEAAGAYTFDGTAATFGAFTVADSLSKFGDEADPDDFAGFVIHSKQRTSLYKDDNFLSADKYGQSVLVRGEIGRIYGVPIVVSDRTTVVVDGGGVGINHYKSQLVKRGALGLLYKRRPVVEQDRDILARSTVLTTNVHYAAARLEDKGVCVATTK